MATVPARLVDTYDKVHGTAKQVTKCVCVCVCVCVGTREGRGGGRKGKEKIIESDFAH